MSLKKLNHSIPKAVWASIQAVAKETQELVKSQKENAKAQKETDRQLKESQKEIAKAQKETDRQLKESQKEIAKAQKEIAKAQKETDRQLKESQKDTNQRIAQLNELFTGQWGKLMEAFVKGDLVKLLQERNIDVNDICSNREKTFEGQKYEFDIIAINGKETVAVEVKTTLRLKDLTYFLKKLKTFKKMFPEYEDKKIYGAMAFIKVNEGADRRAEKDGLFVIQAVGDSGSIINAKHFKPKIFCNNNSKK